MVRWVVFNISISSLSLSHSDHSTVSSAERMGRVIYQTDRQLITSQGLSECLYVCTACNQSSSDKKDLLKLPTILYYWRRCKISEICQVLPRYLQADTDLSNQVCKTTWLALITWNSAEIVAYRMSLCKICVPFFSLFHGAEQGMHTPLSEQKKSGLRRSSGVIAISVFLSQKRSA